MEMAGAFKIRPQRRQTVLSDVGHLSGSGVGAFARPLIFAAVTAVAGTGSTTGQARRTAASSGGQGLRDGLGDSGSGSLHVAVTAAQAEAAAEQTFAARNWKAPSPSGSPQWRGDKPLA